MKSKLPHTGTTIFTIMSALANKEQALNLSQGFPEFDCAADLQSGVSEFMRKGKNQYAPMPGIPELREVLASKIADLYSVSPGLEEITISAGGTQALYTAISCVVSQGDEVIVFDPAYDSYDPAIRLNGGIPVHIALNSADYSIPWDTVRSRITPQTRLIIINSPHNPTGSVLNQGDLETLNRICKENDLYILSDEVYEHITFDGLKHVSVLDHPELYQRAFAVFSFGKTFHNTGWKMGYCVAPEPLMAEYRKVHQFMVFSCNTPVQYALAEYLENKSSYLDLPDFYQHKRDLFRSAIVSSRFKSLPCSGTYFQLLDYSAVTDESDTDYAVRLTKEYKLASIPVSVFYEGNNSDKVLRFCFAKNDDTLLKAAEILCRI